MSQAEGLGEVTQLLERWRQGDATAFHELIPLIYNDLHRIAQGMMRRERSDHTLQATALLNEVYLRLLNQRKVCWGDRVHFFTFAARLMRNILIDHARRRMAQKHGGSDRIDLPLAPDLAWIGTKDEQILDLHRALDRLESTDPRKAKLVELRFFLSFTTEEAAEAMDISLSTAERDIQFSRGWLYRELRGALHDEPSGTASL